MAAAAGTGVERRLSEWRRTLASPPGRRFPWQSPGRQRVGNTPTSRRASGAKWDRQVTARPQDCGAPDHGPRSPVQGRCGSGRADRSGVASLGDRPRAHRPVHGHGAQRAGGCFGRLARRGRSQHDRALPRGLRSDCAAVAAALREPWSNGQTEGQINRLKTLKRQMYGRANIDLLRARLVAAS